MTRSETLERRIIVLEGSFERFKDGLVKISPVFAPIGWFSVATGTYFYAYFAAKNHYDTANGFLVLDLFTLPFAAVLTIALAYRLRQKH